MALGYKIQINMTQTKFLDLQTELLLINKKRMVLVEDKEKIEDQSQILLNLNFNKLNLNLLEYKANLE